MFDMSVLNKKSVKIGLAIVGVVGIGYYMYKSKKAPVVVASAESETATSSVNPEVKPVDVAKTGAFGEPMLVSGVPSYIINTNQ